ncbi:MAG: hypothetical protein H0U25_07795 [Thermoleophilaceae bacterium]|nr:hypothetical protein [Thermoleophilaceae bacterium]
MISSTTAPGDALHLFADAASPAFSSPVAVDAPEPRAPLDPGPEPAYRRRERLREERAALVSQLARSRKQEHRAVNAWINREVGLRTVGDATAEQLAHAIERLRRELRGPIA